MRNWQTLILSVILASIVAYGIHDWRSHRGGADLDGDDADVIAANRTPRTGAQVRPTGNSQAPQAATPTTSSDPIATSSGPAMDDNQVREKFTQALHDMGTCLGVKALPPGNGLEPTLDNWMETIKGDLGEAVLQTEDWSTVDLTTSSGERRRIRVEMDYSGADRIVRRVRYSRMSGEAQEPIPLTTEQSEDPNETFLASLESDGQVSAREKAQRIYFGDGAEVVVTEKNGHIADITMNRSGRSFHCAPSEPEACKCQSMGDEYQSPPNADE